MVGIKTLIGGNRDQMITCLFFDALIVIAAIGVFTSPMSTRTSIIVVLGATIFGVISFALGARYERFK
jgi:positive regulator of sigma E activity